MRVIFTDPFKRDYAKLPPHIQQALDKALIFFFSHERYPSLRIKKLPGTSIWYGRLTRGYRFTFQYQDNCVMLRRVGTHKILDNERKKP